MLANVVPVNDIPVPAEYVVFVSVAEIVPFPAIAIFVPAVRAATTFVVSVTSAEASMPLSLLFSAVV